MTWLFYRDDDSSPAVALVLEIAAEVASDALPPVPSYLAS